MNFYQKCGLSPNPFSGIYRGIMKYKNTYKGHLMKLHDLKKKVVHVSSNESVKLLTLFRMPHKENDNS